MEYMTLLTWPVAALTGSILLNVLASEAYDWCGWLATKLVRFASKRLLVHQDRFEEEWLAHLDDCPGKIGKLLHAAGVLFFVERIRRTRMRHIYVKARAQVITSTSNTFKCSYVGSFFVPLLLTIYMVITYMSGLNIELYLVVPRYSLTFVNVISGVIFVILDRVLRQKALRLVVSDDE